jgi:hypothetical protein
MFMWGLLTKLLVPVTNQVFQSVDCKAKEGELLGSSFDCNIDKKSVKQNNEHHLLKGNDYPL